MRRITYRRGEKLIFRNKRRAKAIEKAIRREGHTAKLKKAWVVRVGKKHRSYYSLR